MHLGVCIVVYIARDVGTKIDSTTFRPAMNRALIAIMFVTTSPPRTATASSSTAATMSGAVGISPIGHTCFKCEPVYTVFRKSERMMKSELKFWARWASM